MSKVEDSSSFKPSEMEMNEDITKVKATLGNFFIFILIFIHLAFECSRSKERRLAGESNFSIYARLFSKQMRVQNFHTCELNWFNVVNSVVMVSIAGGTNTFFGHILGEVMLRRVRIVNIDSVKDSIRSEGTGIANALIFFLHPFNGCKLCSKYLL